MTKIKIKDFFIKRTMNNRMKIKSMNNRTKIKVNCVSQKTNDAV